MAEVLIAGAGLGGLTAGLALLQKGHRVRIFEQASELREVGAGVQLGANGTRILIALGLEAAMKAVVCEAVSGLGWLAGEVRFAAGFAARLRAWAVVVAPFASNQSPVSVSWIYSSTLPPRVKPWPETASVFAFTPISGVTA